MIIPHDLILSALGVFWLVLSFFLFKGYTYVASKYSITTVQTSRGLHSGVKLRGAGIVFLVLYIMALGILTLMMPIHTVVNLPFVVCIILYSLFSFIDDIYYFEAGQKLIVQLIIVIVVSISFVHGVGYGCFSSSVYVATALISLMGFFLLWYLNLFNFIDGADLFATVASLTVLLPTFIFMLYNSTFYISLLTLSILLPLISFISFNKSPAKLLMGDAGSSFLSLFILYVIMYSVKNNILPISYWLIVSGYYICDTSLCTLMRILLFPKEWNHPHRTHAYQHLVVRLNSHMKVSAFVGSINLFWFIPLAFVSLSYPHYKYYILLVAYIPTGIFCVYHGPLSLLRNKDFHAK